jgi:hypothetical protein
MVKNPIALMLSRFLENNEQRTLLLRGAWGVGKSYVVEDFVASFDFSKSNLVARSYVSLFGKQSIQDVQRNIFAVATQIGSDEQVRQRLGRAAHRLIQLEKYLSESRTQRTLRWLSSKAGQIQLPWIGGLGAMFNQGNYAFVDGFLVTLDDLERRSESVPFKDILGLVDDLAVHRNCKVIVVCNEDVLSDSEKDLLASFKEKIFDLDLLLSRAPREIATIGLPAGSEHRDVSEDIFEKLGVSNIRVVRRYAFLVEQIWHDIAQADTRIVKEILEHIAILAWARYDSTAQIPQAKLGYLASESSWMASAIRSEKNEPKETWEINWEAAADALQFSSETYDQSLIEYMRTGIWTPGELSKVVTEKSLHLEQLEAAESLRAAWRLYADSLRPDQAAFVDALKESIRRHSTSLSPRDVDSAFHALEDLGVDIGDLAENYIRDAGDEIRKAALEDWPFGDFQSKAIRPLVGEERSKSKSLPTIDAALERISIQRSWSEEDILSLDSCSEDDLFEWMQSDPPNLSAKIRHGLLFFASQSSDSRYKSIGEKAVRALKRVAAMSELNKIRVEKMFNVKIDA